MIGNLPAKINGQSLLQNGTGLMKAGNCRKNWEQKVLSVEMVDLTVFPSAAETK